MLHSVRTTHPDARHPLGGEPRQPRDHRCPPLHFNHQTAEGYFAVTPDKGRALWLLRRPGENRLHNAVR